MRIYLDYAATTPVDESVKKVMEPFLSGLFGNAGSLHVYGQEASSALDLSREKVANLIGAGFREIIFTGSATEANNLAIRGAVKKAGSKHGLSKPKIIISAIEHESVLETARDLARESGAEIAILQVDKEGFVNPNELEKLLDKNTVLVSVMYANNEVGSVEPIKEIAAAIKKFKNETGVYPLLHTDAVQAFQYLPCNVADLGVDLMTISSHKIYGPKGVGALYVKNISAGIDPIITGGGQEFGLRSGTENIAGIVGFASAAEIAAGIREKENERVERLRNLFYEKIKSSLREAELNGPNLSSPGRLPNNLNIYFPRSKADELLIACSTQGIAVSAGSACQSRSSAPSHVLRAMYGNDERAIGSLRITFGRGTTGKEIDTATGTIIKIIGEKSNPSTRFAISGQTRT